MKLGFIKFTLSNVRYPHDSTRIASVDLQRMKILPNYTENENDSTRTEVSKTTFYRGLKGYTGCWRGI